MKSLASSFLFLTALRQLDLTENNLQAAGAGFLAPSLGCLSTLEILDLGRNTIGAASAVAELLPSLRRLPALRELTLDQGSGMDKAAETIRGSLPNRVKLTLKPGPVGGRHMAGSYARPVYTHTGLRQFEPA